MSNINNGVELLKQYWNEIAPVQIVLTMDDEASNKKVDDFFESMYHFGLTRETVHVYYGNRAPQGANQKMFGITIFGNHYDAARYAAENYPGKSVAIFEDDCRVVPRENIDKVQNRLLKTFQYIHSLPQSKWSMLTLGQAALGFCFHASHPVYYTSRPYAAHSYILNGQKLPTWINEIPRHRWSRPYFVEGFKALPLKEKLAVWPNVTWQCIIPKEMRKITGSFLDFDRGTTMLNQLAVSRVWIIIVILSAVVSIVVIRLAKMKK